MQRTRQYILHGADKSAKKYCYRKNFQFLPWIFYTYGDIDSDTVAEEAKKVLELSYDLQNPITDVFEPIQELKQLAIAGNGPYTQAQIVSFGVTVISNTHDFETALIN